MGAIEPQVAVAPGARHTPTPEGKRQTPSSVQLAPGAYTGWCYLRDIAVTYRQTGVRYTDIIPAGQQARVWQGSQAASDAADVTLFDLTGARWKIFSLPAGGGVGQLYAIRSADWDALVASLDVLALEYQTATGWRRLQVRRRGYPPQHFYSDLSTRMLSLYYAPGHIPPTIFYSDLSTKMLSLATGRIIPFTQFFSDLSTKMLSITNPHIPTTILYDDLSTRMLSLATAGPPPLVHTVVNSGQGGILCLDLWTGGGNNTPPANWQTLGFSPAGWAAPTVIDTFQPAYDLWAQNPARSTIQQVLFRHAFPLPAGTVTTASIFFDFADGVNGIWVNGTFLPGTVGSDPRHFAGTVTIPPSVLRPGAQNCIALWGQNPNSLAHGDCGGDWTLTIN